MAQLSVFLLSFPDAASLALHRLPAEELLQPAIASTSVDRHQEATEVDHRPQIIHRETVEDTAPLYLQEEVHRLGGTETRLREVMEVDLDQEIVIRIHIGHAHTHDQGRPEQDQDHSRLAQGLALHHEGARITEDETAHHHQEGVGEGGGEVQAIPVSRATATVAVAGAEHAMEGEGDVVGIRLGWL